MHKIVRTSPDPKEGEEFWRSCMDIACPDALWDEICSEALGLVITGLGKIINTRLGTCAWQHRPEQEDGTRKGTRMWKGNTI